MRATAPHRVTQAQLAVFVAEAQAVFRGGHTTIFQAGLARQFASGLDRSTAHYRGRSLDAVFGPRYARLEARLSSDDPPFAYGFVDLSSGCVLYASTFARPDLVPRGNLLDPLDPSHGRAALGPLAVRQLDDPALDPGVLAALRRKYAPETIKAGTVAAPVRRLPVPEARNRTEPVDPAWHLPIVPPEGIGVVIPSCTDRSDLLAIPIRSGVGMRIGGEADLCFRCGPEGSVYHPGDGVSMMAMRLLADRLPFQLGYNPNDLTRPVMVAYEEEMRRFLGFDA
jgi:hypothetical protein